MQKKTERPLMERTRAAVGYCNSKWTDEGTDMAAFMALFHPEYDADKTREIVNEARESGSRRRR